MEEKDEVKLIASLEKIGERTQTTLDNMNDIIWSIKPGNDTLSDVLSRMRDYAGTILEAGGIPYSIEFPDIKTDLNLPLGLKNNMFLIFKEAVNNLAKYSRSTKASIRLSIDEKKISVFVEDNGVGFDAGTDSKGNGLTNMKRRAEESNAQLNITSHVGKGTIVELHARF
jgi:signal transduction histidine kinase